MTAINDLIQYKQENEYKIFLMQCAVITRRWLLSEITEEQAINDLYEIGAEFGKTTLIDCAETILEGFDT